jgi:hypothetical protein
MYIHARIDTQISVVVIYVNVCIYMCKNKNILKDKSPSHPRGYGTLRMYVCMHVR